MRPGIPPAPVPRVSLALRQLRTGFGPSTEPPRAVRELRRCVPPLLLERIDRRGLVDLGETCVSVLAGGFHGATTYASIHPSRAVFSILCRFAADLTRAVEQEGGEICELHHDGVIAIFGTGASQAHMEQHAVAAAWEIAEAARRTPLETNRGAENSGLSTALGVATGDAYVGGIHAGGRIYWSVVGDASNRAARLRDVARRNGVPVAVDLRSHETSCHRMETDRQLHWRPMTTGLDGNPEAFLLSRSKR